MARQANGTANSTFLESLENDLDDLFTTFLSSIDPNDVNAAQVRIASRSEENSSSRNEFSSTSDPSCFPGWYRPKSVKSARIFGPQLGITLRAGECRVVKNITSALRKVECDSPSTSPGGFAHARIVRRSAGSSASPAPPPVPGALAHTLKEASDAWDTYTKDAPTDTAKMGRSLDPAAADTYATLARMDAHVQALRKLSARYDAVYDRATTNERREAAAPVAGFIIEKDVGLRRLLLRGQRRKRYGVRHLLRGEPGVVAPP